MRCEPDAHFEIEKLLRKYGRHLRGKPRHALTARQELLRYIALWESLPTMFDFIFIGQGWKGLPRAANYSNRRFEHKSWLFNGPPWEFTDVLAIQAPKNDLNSDPGHSVIKAFMNLNPPCQEGYEEALLQLASKNLELDRSRVVGERHGA